MADEHKSPVDQALDLFLFAPLGLALTAKDELPNLINKGRQRAMTQVNMAKMIGQFTVTMGQKEAGKAATKLAGQAATAAGQAAAAAGRLGLPARPEPTNAAARAVPASAPTAPYEPAPARKPAATANGHNGSANGRPGADPPSSADHLAIPGYDSLSASQVVQRLAGLAAPELAAVRHYEEVHRGRRTILSKIGQLEQDRG
jgi:hypothetical protein